MSSCTLGECTEPAVVDFYVAGEYTGVSRCRQHRGARLSGYDWEHAALSRLVEPRPAPRVEPVNGEKPGERPVSTGNPGGSAA